MIHLALMESQNNPVSEGSVPASQDLSEHLVTALSVQGINLVCISVSIFS